MANQSSIKGTIWAAIIGAVALVIVAVINRGPIFGIKPAPQPATSFVGIVQGSDRKPIQGATVGASIDQQPEQTT